MIRSIRKDIQLDQTAGIQNIFQNSPSISPQNGFRGIATMGNNPEHSQWFLAPYCIGVKLRTLRTEKQLTLARLAAETGLSTALLSKLETDRMTPTLPTLATICRVYGIGLGYFFSEASQHSLSITRQIAKQGRGRNNHVEFKLQLNPGIPGRLMDAAVMELEPGSAAAGASVDADSHASGCFSPSSTQPVDPALLIYVLEGSLYLELGGRRETLDAGDCAYLESDMPLVWGSVGNARCRFLTVSPSQQTSKKNQDRSDIPPIASSGTRSDS